MVVLQKVELDWAELIILRHLLEEHNKKRPKLNDEIKALMAKFPALEDKGEVLLAKLNHGFEELTKTLKTIENQG